MSKVILHIGLPKTATTLLQDHVFNKAVNDIDYAGVIHPRHTKQDELYLKVINCISYDDKHFLLQKAELLPIISRRVSALGNRNLILSEEGFTVDSNNCTWQKKLVRLGELFKDYQTEILVTTRDPVAAVYSYYVEQFHNVSKVNKDVVDFGNNSNLSKIYQYDYLHSILLNSFRDIPIYYVDFSGLKDGSFISKVTNIVGIHNFDFSSLPSINTKARSSKGVVTHHKNLSNTLSQTPIARLLGRSAVCKKLLKNIAKYLSMIKIPGTQGVVPFLTAYQKKELENLYHESVYYSRNKNQK